MRKQLLEMSNAMADNFENHLSKLDQIATEQQMRGDELDGFKRFLDERERLLDERTIALEKSERESNLVQIRQIAAQRKARIEVLERAVSDLESQRKRMGDEKYEAVSQLAKVKAALPILQAV